LVPWVVPWAGMCLFRGRQLILALWSCVPHEQCSVIVLATFVGSVSTTPVPGSLRAWSPALWEFVFPNISACARLGCLLRSFCCCLRAFCFNSILWLKSKACICLVALRVRRNYSMNNKGWECEVILWTIRLPRSFAYQGLDKTYC